MKKLICIGLAISFLAVAFGISGFNIYDYLKNISSNMPSFTELFADISTAINSIGNGDNTLLSILSLIWQVIVLPINVVVWLFKVITALVPIQFI